METIERTQRLRLFEAAPTDIGRDPEHKLLIALIVRSTLDLLSSDWKEAYEARQWFLRRGNDPFSFSWCCSHVDICSIKLLRELFRLGCFDGFPNGKPEFLRKSLGAFISS